MIQRGGKKQVWSERRLREGERLCRGIYTCWQRGSLQIIFPRNKAVRHNQSKPKQSKSKSKDLDWNIEKQTTALSLGFCHTWHIFVLLTKFQEKHALKNLVHNLCYCWPSGPESSVLDSFVIRQIFSRMFLLVFTKSTPR